jgi:hypothetical protein
VSVSRETYLVKLYLDRSVRRAVIGAPAVGFDDTEIASATTVPAPAGAMRVRWGSWLARLCAVLGGRG